MKRGQASLEFLMTYGWAFLVITIMIGAISYFGVTNPSTFIPERCQFSPEIICEDFQAVAYKGAHSVVMIDIRQTFGRSAYLQDFKCSDPDLSDSSTGFVHADGQALDDTTNSMPFPASGFESLQQWDPAERVTLKCIIDDNPFALRENGDRIRVPIEVTLQKRKDGFLHSVTGELIATLRVES